MGVFLSEWQFERGTPTPSQLAERFEAQTGLRANVLASAARTRPAGYRTAADPSGRPRREHAGGLERMEFPDFGEGLGLARGDRILRAEWDGFPPNPYCLVQFERAAAAAGGRSSSLPSRWPRRRATYDRPWSKLGLPDRVVLRSRVFSIFWR
jgi:hypothetical protein